MHYRTIGAVQVLMAGMFWGTYGTLATFLPIGIPPITVSAIRLGVGTLGLAIILMITRKGRILAKGTQVPVVSLVISSFALATAQIALYYAVRSAGVTIGTMVFVGTPPLYSGLYGQFVKREKQSLSWLVSSLIISAGCILMAISGDVVAEGNRLVLGSLSAAIAGAGWTIVGTLLRNLQKTSTPLESSFMVMGAAAIILLPMGAIRGYTWFGDPQVILLSATLGIVSTAIPYLFFTRGSRKIPASHAFLYGLSEPITASFLGLVLLKERLDNTGSVGYAAVVIGLVLFSVWEFRKAREMELGNRA